MELEASQKVNMELSTELSTLVAEKDAEVAAVQEENDQLEDRLDETALLAAALEAEPKTQLERSQKQGEVLRVNLEAWFLDRNIAVNTFAACIASVTACLRLGHPLMNIMLFLGEATATGRLDEALTAESLASALAPIQVNLMEDLSRPDFVAVLPPAPVAQTGFQAPRLDDFQSQLAMFDDDLLAGSMNRQGVINFSFEDATRDLSSCMKTINGLSPRQLKCDFNLRHRDAMDVGGVTRVFFQKCAQLIAESPIPFLNREETCNGYYVSFKGIGCEYFSDFLLFLGRLVGLCLRNRLRRQLIFPIDLNILFFKLLLQQPLVYDDLNEVDAAMKTGMDKAVAELDRGDYPVEALGIYFAMDLSDIPHPVTQQDFFELKESGNDIEVSSKRELLEHYKLKAEHFLGSRAPLQSFISGFNSVVDIG